MSRSRIVVQKWPEDQTPDEGTLRRTLAEEGLNPYAWSNGPGDVYSAHSHAYHKVIYVVDGSITFGLPDEGRRINLETGDRLELPAELTHNAVVGPRGVICLEAHRKQSNQRG